MKTSFILLLSIVMFIGCNSKSNTNNADSANMEMNEDMTSDTSSNNTWNENQIKEFVTEVTQGSVLEIQLGQAAQKKALSQQVKDFGKMMEKDHGDAKDKLKPVLQTLGYTTPELLNNDNLQKVEKLNKKVGNEFDKDYIDEMVKDHKDDIDEFEKAQKNLPAGELKTWVDNTLPVLRSHLVQAQTIQDQLKNNK